MSAAKCSICFGTGFIEYDRGDDCIPAVEVCQTCAGDGADRGAVPKHQNKHQTPTKEKKL